MNPVRRNAIGLLPNRDWGQRIAHQYRKIPRNMTSRVKPRRSGSSRVCLTTKMIGHTAKMNRRYSGMKVINPKMNARIKTKTESETKKRMPAPNTASMTSLPTEVCAKETILGEVSTRGIRRKSEKPFSADPKYFISLAVSSLPSRTPRDSRSCGRCGLLPSRRAPPPKPSEEHPPARGDCSMVR